MLGCGVSAICRCLYGNAPRKRKDLWIDMRLRSILQNQQPLSHGPGEHALSRNCALFARRFFLLRMSSGQAAAEAGTQGDHDTCLGTSWPRRPARPATVFGVPSVVPGDVHLCLRVKAQLARTPSVLCHPLQAHASQSSRRQGLDELR